MEPLPTQIRHTAFDDPNCPGSITVFMRNGIAEFACAKCGKIVACARECDVSPALAFFQYSIGSR